MARTRRAFSTTFKARVALDAVKGLKTSSELAKSHGVHSTQIALWKKQLIDEASSILSPVHPRQISQMIRLSMSSTRRSES
jgi:transposase-like protein